MFLSCDSDNHHLKANDWTAIIPALEQCAKLKMINGLEWSEKALNPQPSRIHWDQDLVVKYNQNLQQIGPQLDLSRQHLMNGVRTLSKVSKSIHILAQLLMRKNALGLVTLDLR